MARPELSLPSDLTEGGDDKGSGVDVESALDDILGSSDMLVEAGISTHKNADDDDTDNADGNDQPNDESGDEEDEAEGRDNEVPELEETDDDESTGDDDDSDGEGEPGEIDWEFKVPVKVDGEDSEVDLAEVVKGYQTSQHLSKKGRELANERKEFETERTTQMDSLKESAKLLEAQNLGRENQLATEYSDLQAEIKTAKKDGDRHLQDELSDKLEEIQGEYWKARKSREYVAEALATKIKDDEEAKIAIDIKTFNEEIDDYVTDFDKDKATDIREFAISKGIPEEVLSTLIDARIIGAINEFMELDAKVSKGKAKRKAAPKRNPSTNKAKPAIEKKRAAKQVTSKRLQSGEATETDYEDALDSLVGKYFG